MRKILSALFFIFTMSATAQNIAVNTDVLMDVAGAPSLGVELAVSRRSTMNLNATYSPSVMWSFGKAFIVQPEYRFYFSGRPMYRHYVGLVGMYSDYQLHIKNYHYNGNVSGLGLSFGYSKNVSDRIIVDFHSSLGVGFYKHQEWEVTQDTRTADLYGIDDYKRRVHGTICMPLRVGISVAYVLK